MANAAQSVIGFSDSREAVAVLGTHDYNLRLIEPQFEVQIISRGNEVIVRGAPEDVEQVSRVLKGLRAAARAGATPGHHEVQSAIQEVKRNGRSIEGAFARGIVVSTRRQPVRPRTIAQQVYLDAIASDPIVIAVGPAGTGKTYLAVACAVAALERQEYERIILTRPAVEAGESLGYLPGDMLEKVNPYFRPLYDALYDMLSGERVRRMIDQGTIEVAPLAFMRGRTLNHSFVILDEAQNTTSKQMKMFLTRLGYHSKAVITGDVTQTDLPEGIASGLVDARDVLVGVPGIRMIEFAASDVVRHPLVQEIVNAYDRKDRIRNGATERA